MIELRLVLHGLGFGKLGGAKLDGARISRLIEGMRTEVRRSIALASA
jgi:hypothetical protein